MSIGELCNREVVIIDANAPINEAVKLMRDYHVGDVVVVEARGAQRVPVGMLTDRDIVIEILAEAVDPQSLSIRDVMSADLVTVREEEDLTDVIGEMRRHGVRRVPIVNEQGGLEGIVTVDDMLEILAEQMNGLAGLVRTEQAHEQVSRSRP